MKVEKDIPMPATTIRDGYKYPLNEMDIGDSIFEPGPRNSNESKIRLSAKKYGAKTGKRFSARKVEGGVRIWRVE